MEVLRLISKISLAETTNLILRNVVATLPFKYFPLFFNTLFYFNLLFYFHVMPTLKFYMDVSQLQS